MSLGWFIFALALVIGAIVGGIILFKKKNSKVITILKITKQLVDVADKFLEFIDNDPSKNTKLEFGVDVVGRGLAFFVEMVESNELEGKTVEEVVDYVTMHVKEQFDEYLISQRIVLTDSQVEAVDMALKIVGFFVKLFYTEK